MKSKKLLSLILSLIFCIQLLPALTVSAGATATTYNLSSSDSVYIYSAGNYRLTGNAGDCNWVVSVSGGTAEDPINLTLSGVTINRAAQSSSRAGIDIRGYVNLYIDGNNTITAGSNQTSGAQPLDISTATLNIYSKNGSDATDVLNLDATTAGGCAIGNALYNDGCDYTLNVYGGTINAKAGTQTQFGVGLGVILDTYRTSKAVINIHGGIVNAGIPEGAKGVGIGGSSGCAVNIRGGLVNAVTCDGCAAIGSRAFADAGPITISGGTVNASSLANAWNAVAIGSGYGQDEDQASDIRITGGSIKCTVVYPEHGKAFYKTPTTDGATKVYLCKLRVPEKSADVSEKLKITGYGTKGVQSDAEGLVYAYLPAGTVTTSYADGDLDYKPLTLTSHSEGAGEIAFPFGVGTTDGKTVVYPAQAYAGNTAIAAVYDEAGKMLSAQMKEITAGTRFEFEPDVLGLLRLFITENSVPLLGSIEYPAE